VRPTFKMSTRGYRYYFGRAESTMVGFHKKDPREQRVVPLMGKEAEEERWADDAVRGETTQESTLLITVPLVSV
jgi:hypothetical protein